MSANMTTQEIAAELRVTADTIRDWARAGRIPCVRLTKKTIRFELSAVLKALEANTAVESNASKANA